MTVTDVTLGAEGVVGVDDPPPPQFAKEWPEDFAVRAFCEKQQAEALTKLRARTMTATADHYTIRRKCAREWPDDYAVRNFCEETELKALAALGK